MSCSACNCVCKTVKGFNNIFFDIESIKSDVTKHWDLNYKGLDNLSKRINFLEQENEIRKDTFSCMDSAYNNAMLDLEKRINKLESCQLSQQLDPKVWVHINERLDEAESTLAMLQLELKAKQFKADMNEGERFMECLSGLENKLQNQIDDAKAQFKSIYGKRPHECPICKSFGSPFIVSDKCADGPRKHHLSHNPCHGCEGKGIVWG